jgi:hypothetical protein
MCWQKMKRASHPSAKLTEQFVRLLGVVEQSKNGFLSICQTGRTVFSSVAKGDKARHRSVILTEVQKLKDDITIVSN